MKKLYAIDQSYITTYNQPENGEVNILNHYHHLVYTNIFILTPFKSLQFPIHLNLFNSWICIAYYSMEGLYILS